jgi:2-dehydro-3-deoxygluconokinase
MMKVAQKIACIGECMVEVSHQSDGQMGLSYGGDTLNTAVYMSRLGLDVEYVTALGDDPYSIQMIEAWQDEGVGTDFVIRVADRVPGLYAIRTDDRGERSFYYWRDQAPARELLRLPEFATIQKSLEVMDYIYVSGISLSLYSEVDRQQMFELLDIQRENGGKVVFDTNHRPNRWSSPGQASQVYKDILQRTDIALPTIEDEQLLFNDKDAMACADRLHKLGVGEVVIKMGEDGCFVSAGKINEMVPLSEIRQSQDTTGAGDSFNGAYLAARLAGKDCVAAASIAHLIAREVIMHPGAIIPKNAMPEVKP